MLFRYVVHRAADEWAFGIVIFAVAFADLPWEMADSRNDVRQLRPFWGGKAFISSMPPLHAPYGMLVVEDQADLCLMLIGGCNPILRPIPVSRITRNSRPGAGLWVYSSPLSTSVPGSGRPWSRSSMLTRRNGCRCPRYRNFDFDLTISCGVLSSAAPHTRHVTCSTSGPCLL